ncbi:MAG: hypothetical protein WD118_04140 [Phycisphaeraceae bacterium]
MPLAGASVGPGTIHFDRQTILFHVPTVDCDSHTIHVEVQAIPFDRHTIYFTPQAIHDNLQAIHFHATDRDAVCNRSHAT